jgi:FtsP/CotA-like multicopper oxidase with cupredoxin domain
LHVHHFQIVAIEAAEGAIQSLDYVVGDWRDTISVPTPGAVTIRWRADDFAGKTLAHCHIFSHAETGMAMVWEALDDKAWKNRQGKEEKEKGG